MTKKQLIVAGMHCTSCALLIEGELEDIGVTAQCSYAKGTVDVEYDEQKIADTDLSNAVAKAGYTVTG